MAEISGLQSILSNMHRQYTAGSMSFEQYATSVSNVQQQSPEIFEEAVNTPIMPADGFNMSLPLMNSAEPSNIDFTGANAQSPPPNPPTVVDNTQPGGWENFAGLVK
tara:strand:+ start:115 stop:435 length:321 start_codon:yes stop_codon:yes gene_type:complete